MGKLPELEPTGPHLTYLALSFFLVLYALFSELIRNRFHLSEPPLATLTGIGFGPLAVDVLGEYFPSSQSIPHNIDSTQVQQNGVFKTIFSKKWLV